MTKHDDALGLVTKGELARKPRVVPPRITLALALALALTLTL